jgi:arylsulfatase A-like enzyme
MTARRDSRGMTARRDSRGVRKPPFVAAALAAALACATSGCEKKPERPRAIVLVTLDTTRADHLSMYGYERATTPKLDRIAATGVRFAHAISVMPTTDPAHVAMLTGLYPRTHGILQNGERVMQDGLPNLASWARAAGYRTAAFTSRRHLDPDALNLDGFDFRSVPAKDVRPGAETFADARRWLDENADEPFFVWLHVFEPHWPYEPPLEHAAPFLPAGTTTVPQFTQLPPVRPMSDDVIATLVGLYDGEISYMDGLVAGMIEWIDAKLPENDPPLVVVVGDHGEVMGELEKRFTFAFDHGKYLYEGTLHVPLFVRWPGHVKAGHVVETTAEQVDIAPTLFELAGVPGFATYGRSLVPDLLGKSKDESYAFTQRRTLPEDQRKRTGATSQYAVQDAHYKLILSEPGRRTELYDLTSDPGETRDLSSTDPANKDRLLAALDAWLEHIPVAGESSGISPEKVEALRALGYIE